MYTVLEQFRGFSIIQVLDHSNFEYMPNSKILKTLKSRGNSMRMYIRVVQFFSSIINPLSIF